MILDRLMTEIRRNCAWHSGTQIILLLRLIIKLLLLLVTIHIILVKCRLPIPQFNGFD